MSEQRASIELQIRLFAHLRAQVGAATLPVRVPGGITVGELLEHLRRAYPMLEPWLPTTRVAVNYEYATRQTPLKAGDEVALIPPVSGG
jgi:molybdopterin converting factor subunit 1